MEWRKKNFFEREVYCCRDIRNGILPALSIRLMTCLTKGDYSLVEATIKNSKGNIVVIHGDKVKKRLSKKASGYLKNVIVNSEEIVISAEYKGLPFTITVITDDKGKIKKGSLFEFHSEDFNTRELKRIVETVHEKGKSTTHG